MTPRIAIQEGNTGQLVEDDATASRLLDRPDAMSKKTLRERLRLPLLILFPILLGFARAQIDAVQPAVGIAGTAPF
jgi:hypothetical protein